MTDNLIIGAGVVGLSLAFELACHGERVRVIDRGEPGKEASWAGAGILPIEPAGAARHSFEKLRVLSFELHAEWAVRLREETGIDTGYRRCGGIYVARSVGEAASLYGMAALMRDEGVAVERLSADELACVEPALNASSQDAKFVAAYRLPDDAQLRNPDHLKALLAACRNRGVEIDGGVEAGDVTIAEDRIINVQSNSGPISAERYCIASGAWSRRLIERLGITTGIMPVRGQMVMFNTHRPLFSHVINEGPRYLVPREDGRVLAGSTEEEAGFDKSTTDEGIASLSSFAESLVPALTRDCIERTWAGLRPGSFDGFPYIGRAGSLANAFIAAGHFRSGLLLSTGTAVCLASLMLDESPPIDLSPFRLTRG